MNSVRMTSKITGLTASVHQMRRGGWVTWGEDKKPIFMSAKQVKPFLLEKTRSDKGKYFIKFIKRKT